MYRADREAGVRRAVIARDRFADLILAHESPLGVGVSGWVIDHGEAVLSNEAHLDPRSVQVPGTPFEPEAMIVVPLLIDGDTIGTLNIGRMGEAEAAFSANEFELTQLFAGQASIALQNAEIHGAVRVRAEHDALTGLRNHGSFQRELGEAVDTAGLPFSILMLDLDAFKSFNDACGHPAGDALLAGIARALAGATRDGDRLYRYGGDEFAAILPGADRNAAHDVAERIRRAVTELSATIDGPAVTISVGVACHPDDGVTKDALVGVADRAMYQAKPASPSRRGPDETRATPTSAPWTKRRWRCSIVTTMTRTSCSRRSCSAPPPCWARRTASSISWIQPAMCSSSVMARAITRTTSAIDSRRGGSRGAGLPDGQAARHRQLRRVERTRQLRADRHLPVDRRRSADLERAGRRASWVSASGRSQRGWGPRDVSTLTSFAQLASIALDNARLIDEAQRGAMYDQTTGLPNRELLTDRIAHALASSRPDGPGSVGVILLDIDRFKVINETVGHTVGDRLLVAVGQRLVVVPAARRHRGALWRRRVRAPPRGGRRRRRGAPDRRPDRRRAADAVRDG